MPNSIQKTQPPYGISPTQTPTAAQKTPKTAVYSKSASPLFPFQLPSTPKKYEPFITQLASDYPNFRFRIGKKFAFCPPNTIFFGPPQPNYALQTLHELAHGLCGHKDWSNSVSRIKIEREAWERARGLFKTYQKLSPDPWDEDFVENSLDTYRDWLHQKTLCKTCGLTRFQDDSGAFHCPHCENFT